MLNASFSDGITRIVYGIHLSKLPNYYVLIAVPVSWVWTKLLIHNLIIGSIGLIIALLIGIVFYRLALKQLSLKKALRRALKTKEFTLFYQPLIESNNETIQGVEVLIRWKPESEDEIIMPDAFIETAEKTGLIIPLTHWIVEQSINECQDILKSIPAFHLGINLTVAHFYDDKLMTLTLALCEKHDISPSQIMFELTERELITDNQTICNIMHKIRQSGIKLAIDDFGTGYSSLGYLRHFPFTHLKIDKLFTSAIGTGAITESISLSIIELARKLNYKMIAEGVETQEQVNYLIDKKVELLQGWYYSKAMPIEDLKKFINTLQGGVNEN